MKRIEWGVKPYGDNSGFEYTIFLTEDDGQVRILIQDAGRQPVCIEAADWPMLRDRMDDILGFALARQTPDAQAQKDNQP